MAQAGSAHGLLDGLVRPPDGAGVLDRLVGGRGGQQHEVLDARLGRGVEEVVDRAEGRVEEDGADSLQDGGIGRGDVECGGFDAGRRREVRRVAGRGAHAVPVGGQSCGEAAADVAAGAGHEDGHGWLLADGMRGRGAGERPSVAWWWIIFAL